MPLCIPVSNWFNHTNLKEISARWKVNGELGTVAGPDVAPQMQGTLVISPRDWKDGEILQLTFHDRQNGLIDEYNLQLNPVEQVWQGSVGPAPDLAEEGGSLIVSGMDFTIVFSKETGMITEGVYKGEVVINGGPYLNLIGIDLPEWTLYNLLSRKEECEAVIDIYGCYGLIKDHFELRIDGNALITTDYTLDKMPVKPPQARVLKAETDVGGVREVGVSYILSSKVDRLSWKRKGLWSAYPNDHIGRTSGTAARFSGIGTDRYGEKPAWPWAKDMRKFLLFGRYDTGGRGTEDFRSMRYGILCAFAEIVSTGTCVCAESDGTDAVRLETVDSSFCKVDDRDSAVRFGGNWKAMDDERGNYQGTVMYGKTAGDYAEFVFQGTGIAWIGSKDLIHGKADVYVDGVLEAAETDLYARIGCGTARGDEKLYQQVLFSREGLTGGVHCIRVVVTGTKHPDSGNTYVSVDAFVVLGHETDNNIKFIINNEWNYPELTWGNYSKPPVMVSEGYTNRVRMRLKTVNKAGALC